MDNSEGQKQTSLGRDFLTYLCYRSDSGAGIVDVSENVKQFFIWIDGKIVLEDDRGTPANTVSYSGDDFSTADLKQTIRAGKKVKEARLRIECGETIWAFTLKADRLEISGLKIDMPRTNDPDERFFDRILNIEALNNLLDDIYKQFLFDVSENRWREKGYQEFQKWLQKA
jgi:hypothetical protein